MKTRLYNPTGRKTQAHIVEIGPHSLFFSYETCIAYSGPTKNARILNHWGPTTGKHFKELGCSEFNMFSTEEFEKIINEAIK